MNTSIRVKKIRLGDEVTAACGRCKGERTHQVAALNQNGVPAIVICRTCGGRHGFREKREGKSLSASAKRTGKRETGATISVPRKPARSYSPREAYSEGEWIDHPKFGQGEVVEIRDNKIEVKFGVEKRLLIHAH
jgi:hypothetical protein